MDVKGDGGCVLAPPTIHPSGEPYEWLDDADAMERPADLPEWLHSLVLADRSPSRTVGRTDGPIPDGARNKTLTQIAGAMRRAGMTPEEIEEALMSINEKRCDPPLPEREVRKVAKSIGRYPAEPPAEANRARDPVPIPPWRPFPVDALPEPLRDLVREGAEAIRCDPSYIALPLLAVLASAIGATRRIRLKRTWTEPAIIWALIVGKSGTHKSPALDVVLDPIRRRQELAIEKNKAETKEHLKKVVEYKTNLKEWEKDPSGDPPEKPEEPKPARFIIGDITIEAVAMRLEENLRGLLLARDELSTWIGGFDRYSSAAARDRDAAAWCEIHGGRSIIVDRKTGSKQLIYVTRPALSITGGVQPRILRRILRPDDFARGLPARLLLAAPTPPEGDRWSEAEISEAVEVAVGKIIERLLDLDFVRTMDREGRPELRPFLLDLSPDAKKKWIKWVNSLGDTIREADDDESAAWSKVEGYAARIALVLALTEDPDALKVGAKAIERGIRIARWAGREAERVYAMLAEEPEARADRELVEYVRRKGGRISIRALTRGPRAYRGNSARAEADLNRLAETGRGQWEWEDGGRYRVFLLSSAGDGDSGDGDTSGPGGVKNAASVAVAASPDSREDVPGWDRETI